MMPFTRDVMLLALLEVSAPVNIVEPYNIFQSSYTLTPLMESVVYIRTDSALFWLGRLRWWP